ncbi:MAG: hypothetical protein WAO35_25415 [Terriglobia bacterium]
MKLEATVAFASIESAEEYLGLLAQVVIEAQEAVQADIQGSVESDRPRRVEALRLIEYKVDKLASHLKASRRILNDLRMLRRILQERGSAEVNE